MIQLLIITLIAIIQPKNTIARSRALNEGERLKEYHARGYTWPIETYVPNTKGWKKLMERRFRQVQFVQDDRDRYNGWLQVVSNAVVTQNFTEYGWGLARAPQHVVDLLKESLYKGLNETNVSTEGEIKVINDNGNHAFFIHQPELNNKVLHELLPMHERWSGVKLEPSIAYGLRAYRNSSVLLMHSDRLSTHVISCILHVDHSPDSEPWPILIEDFKGNTNEVYLESGDMLFYESSKCLHGRPKEFVGSWYSSIFVHYRPVGWDVDEDLKGHYAVPPIWSEVLPERQRDVDELQVIGTGYLEPKCVNNWCALSKQTKKWYGPAPEGGPVIDPGSVYNTKKIEDNTCSSSTCSSYV